MQQPSKLSLWLPVFASFTALWLYWPARVYERKLSKPIVTIATAAEDTPAAVHINDGSWRQKLGRLCHEPADPARGDRLVELSRQIPASEVSGVLEGLSEEELRSDFGISLFQRTVAHRPFWALRWAELVQDDNLRGHLLNLALAAATEQEGEATLHWWETLPESGDKKWLQARLARAFLDSQPIVALQLALDMPESSLADGRALAEEAVGAWAGRDLNAARAWVENLTDPRLREKLAAAVARSWSETDSSNALAFLLQSVASGHEQEKALLAILQRDPRGVSRWMAMLSHEQVARLSDTSLYILWAGSDPVAAANWAASSEKGRARDEAFAVSVWFLARDDPELAGKLAQTIEDGHLAELSQNRIRTFQQ